MNSYKSSTPRVASGLTAVLMVAITMGVLVVLPAKFDSLSEDPYTLAVARAATMAMTGAVAPARIDGADVTDPAHAAGECPAMGAQASREKPHRLSARSQTST